MKWNMLLDDWEKSKNLPVPPSNFPKDTAYMLKTYNLTQKENQNPVLIFYESPRLGRIKQADWNKFTDKIEAENKKYKPGKVTSFETPSGAIVIVPMPTNNTDDNFKSLQSFTLTASPNIQRELWKTVAKKARKILKHSKSTSINTHGLSVPYLHVRVEADQHKSIIE